MSNSSYGIKSNVITQLKPRSQVQITNTIPNKDQKLAYKLDFKKLYPTGFKNLSGIDNKHLDTFPILDKHIECKWRHRKNSNSI